MKLIKTIVLAAFVAAAISGCNDDSGDKKVNTVAEYLHNIDLANARLHAVKKDPISAANDPDAVNASAAVGHSMSPKVQSCWSGQVTTANVDHACLDSLGFKR